MFSENDYRAYVKYLIKKEVKKSHIEVSEIAEKLDLDAKHLRTKLARGAYTAGSFMSYLYALGCKNLDLSDMEDFLKNRHKKQEDNAL